MRTYSLLKKDGENEAWFETIRRVVEGTYFIQKKHIIKNGLGWSEHRGQKSAEEMYDRMFNMKFLPPGRGLWAMGTDMINERGLYEALNNCFGGETEILTKDGVKRIKDCAGTIQKVLTHKGNWIAAPINSFGKQETSLLTLRRGKKAKVIEVTPNHRWLFPEFGNRSFKEKFTKDLVVGEKIPYQFGAKSPSVRPSAFGIAQGIVYGDGTSGHLYLCGDKDAELAKWFPLSPQTIDVNKCEGGAIRVADLPKKWKELPSMEESKSLLLGWLMGYFAADGHSSGGQICLDSNDKKSVEFAMIAATHLGIKHYGISEIKNSSSFKENYITYRLSFNRSSIDESFFLIQKHKEDYLQYKKENYTTQQWVVESITKGEEQEVFCATVEGYGSFTLADNILTGNCAFVSTKDMGVSIEEATKPFEFLMDMSMLGVGVGFDTKGAGKLKLKNPTKQGVFQIPDTREGWVESVKIILKSFFSQSCDLPEMDPSLVRAAGEPIRTFGGTSSGPGPLLALHSQLIVLLSNREGELLTETDIVDIQNMIGCCVVAGNVRRTAEIVFGEPDSEEYLKLKDYRWNADLGEINLNTGAPYGGYEGESTHRAAWGWTSNNSVFARLGMGYHTVAAQTARNGEPGYAWLANMQKYGRMNNDPIDLAKYWVDRRVVGGNPCLEQSLESYELCCLVETFPTMCTDVEDYLRTLKFAYLYAKTVTLGQTSWAETNRVMLRNRRIGTSQSGIAQYIEKEGIDNYIQLCDKGYKTIQRYDEVYSEWLCIPRSVKTTSIKPSGTVSLLPGVTPGMHYPEANYYVRRIRIASSSALIQKCIAAGYHVEPDVVSQGTSVVEIPVHIQGVRTIDQVSMWEQLSLAALIQKWWADNQVSCTITFQASEASQIESALNYFQYQLKGVSFLPKLEMGNTTYAQMPYEEIDQQTYERMAAKVSQLVFNNISEDSSPEKYCDSDSCNI
jgi:adenosylcobalamin-dependent ribonucleoside-triphosphate reductase